MQQEIVNAVKRPNPYGEEVCSWFIPNRSVSRSSRVMLRLIWVCILALIWHFVPVLPSPGSMWDKFSFFITEYGLLGDIMTSLSVNIRAVVFSCIISLGLVYLAVIPFNRPVVEFLSYLRYLSPAAMLVIFLLYAPDGDWLKVIILTCGMSVYIIADMSAEILNIKKDQYEEAWTQGMNELRVTYEVVVRGKADAALKALRVSAGMGWAMITLVEGLVKNEGGIGTILLGQERHLDLPGMFAIAILLLVIGIAIDAVLDAAGRYWLCRWAYIRQGRSA